MAGAAALQKIFHLHRSAPRLGEPQTDWSCRATKRPNCRPSALAVASDLNQLRPCRRLSARQRPVQSEAPPNEEPNDEDEIFFFSAAAPAITRYSSTVQARTHVTSLAAPSPESRVAKSAAPPWSAACMTDHAPKPMRRAHVGLREPPLRPRFRKCVMKSVACACSCERLKSSFSKAAIAGRKH